MKKQIFTQLIVFILSNLTNTSGTCYKVAFGSCFKEYVYEDSSIFNSISKTNPNVFVWLGDIVYLDHPDMTKPIDYLFFKTEGDIKSYRSRWEQSVNDHNYLKFKNNIGKENIYSIWDDHDFGINDGDKNWHMKNITQGLFLEYMEEPKDSVRWSRNGLYESYNLTEDVQLILLDNRYHAMPQSELSNAKFHDSFGEEQWTWFEQQISLSKAKVTIIGAGVQFIDYKKSIMKALLETIYPDSKRRLYEILRKYKKSGVVFLSGDVHYGDINRDDCAEKLLGYKTYDFTSSGQTHGVADDYTLYMLTYVYDYISPRYYGIGFDKYYHNNFGVLNICSDDQNDDFTVNLELHGYEGSVYEKKLSQKEDLTFKDVQKNNSDNKNFNLQEEYQKCESKNSNFKEVALENYANLFKSFDGLVIVLKIAFWLYYQDFFIIIIKLLIFWLMVRLAKFTYGKQFKKSYAENNKKIA